MRTTQPSEVTKAQANRALELLHQCAERSGSWPESLLGLKDQIQAAIDLVPEDEESKTNRYTRNLKDAVGLITVGGLGLMLLYVLAQLGRWVVESHG